MIGAMTKDRPASGKPRAAKASTPAPPSTPEGRAASARSAQSGSSTASGRSASASQDVGEDATPNDGRPSQELVDRLTAQLARARAMEINGLLQVLGRKRKLLTVNFLAGLARGAGFFLGLTLVGGLIIGATAMIFDFTARTFGMKDVSFTSLIRSFAEKAVEAERVWQDVRDEQGGSAGSPDVDAVDPPGAGLAPPRDESEQR